MSAHLKPKQVRLYLDEEGEKLFRKLCDRIADLSESQLSTVLLVAALKCLEEENCTLTLPLRFRMEKPK